VVANADEAGVAHYRLPLGVTADIRASHFRPHSRIRLNG
jgi:hypothetical protein